MILVVIAALVARLDASTDDRAVALARQFADAITGVDDDDDAAALDDPDDPDAMARHDAVRGDEDPRGDEDDDGTDRVDGAECVDAIEGLDDAECADDDPCADCTDAADRDGVADAQAAADPGANGPDSEDDWDPEASTGSPPGDDRAGALALRDAEQAPFDAALGADATAASATAGAEERYEAWMRRFRASPWGRLDFGVAWRRWSTQPRYAPPTLHHEWWIVATWRR